LFDQEVMDGKHFLESQKTWLTRRLHYSQVANAYFLFP
jgi:hypothetical protein